MILRESISNVQAGTADNWPDWTDDDRWFVTLDPDDAQEASQLLNDQDWHTDEATPDDVLEQQAGEALAQDLLERGIRCF